jgi:hypothetical protein
MHDEPGDFHIVLVHGMRTSDRNTWVGFRALLCQHVADPCLSAPERPITQRLVLSAQAPNANFLGTPVWPTYDSWIHGQPFIDHYIYQLKSGRRLILDEINWWPLVFAFKCQFLVAEDTTLAGTDKDNIGNCAKADDPYFPWFNGDEKNTLLATWPVSGGAPVLNGALKTQILDWGISDAVLALGTLKSLLRETIRCSFSDIAEFDRRVATNAPLTVSTAGGPNYVCGTQNEAAKFAGAPSGARFVLISHSLGAFILMDTFAAAAADAKQYPQQEDNCRTYTTAPLTELRTQGLSPQEASRRSRNSQALCLILGNSNNLYFFANQFALLELGRAQGLTEERAGLISSACTDALSLWAGCGLTPGLKQIVAFSDPGDILTFRVPKIPGATVINVYTHNSTDWLGLFESPEAAHVNYITGDKILGIVFGKQSVRKRETPWTGLDQAFAKIGAAPHLSGLAEQDLAPIFFTRLPSPGRIR